MNYSYLAKFSRGDKIDATRNRDGFTVNNRRSGWYFFNGFVPYLFR